MPLPRLETARLILRDWTAADEPAMLEIYGDPEVTRWMGGMTALKDLAEVAAFRARVAERGTRYAKGQGAWAIEDRATGCAVGAVLLKALPDNAGAFTEDIEIGWHLAPKAWGKGYATEAAQRLLTYGFEALSLDIIHAVITPGNTRSVAVAERLGLSARGTATTWYNAEVLWFSRCRDGAPFARAD